MQVQLSEAMRKALLARGLSQNSLVPVVTAVKDPRYLLVVEDTDPFGDNYLVAATNLKVAGQLTEELVAGLIEQGNNGKLILAWDTREDKEMPARYEPKVIFGNQ